MFILVACFNCGCDAALFVVWHGQQFRRISEDLQKLMPLSKIYHVSKSDSVAARIRICNSYGMGQMDQPKNGCVCIHIWTCSGNESALPYPWSVSNRHGAASDHDPMWHWRRTSCVDDHGRHRHLWGRILNPMDVWQWDNALKCSLEVPRWFLFGMPWTDLLFWRPFCSAFDVGTTWRVKAIAQCCKTCRSQHDMVIVIQC